jgi:hypothetical protein
MLLQPELQMFIHTLIPSRMTCNPAGTREILNRVSHMHTVHTWTWDRLHGKLLVIGKLVTCAIVDEHE